MSILIKGIPLGGYEISIMKDGERYRARVDGIWCDVEEIPTTDTDSDTISRKAAIDALRAMQTYKLFAGDDMLLIDQAGAQTELMMLPPANNSEIPNSSDTISRKAAIDALERDMASLDHIIKGMSANDVRLDAYVSQRNQVNYDIYTINNLPPVQPEQLGTNLAEVGTDLISRQAAISAICNACGKIDCDKMDKCEKLQLPPANCSEFPNNSDTISRQAAIDALDKRFDSIPMEQTTEILQLRKDLRKLPSAQPEQHTCVNCGRTVNNGGWYADGRTRCPIEEHYALPKDGYCHLWEKRNVTDDDYPERREE